MKHSDFHSFRIRCLAATDLLARWETLVARSPHERLSTSRRFWRRSLKCAWSGRRHWNRCRCDVKDRGACETTFGWNLRWRGIKDRGSRETTLRRNLRWRGIKDRGSRETTLRRKWRATVGWRRGPRRVSIGLRAVIHGLCNKGKRKLVVLEGTK
jgi:hypothetical protein